MIREKYEKSVQDYVEAFMRKHHLFDEETGEYYDYWWVGDDIGQILCVSDCYINFHELKIDIDEAVDEKVFFDYYNHSVDNNIKINYKSYLMGAR